MEKARYQAGGFHCAPPISKAFASRLSEAGKEIYDDLRLTGHGLAWLVSRSCCLARLHILTPRRVSVQWPGAIPYRSDFKEFEQVLIENGDQHFRNMT